MKKAPLRILQIIESSSGGAGRHTLELSQQLARQGHHVDVIYSTGKIDEHFESEIETMKSMGVGMFHIEMPRGIGFGEFTASFRIRKHLKTQPKYDIMHVQSALAGFAGRLARIGRKQTTIYTPHLLRSAVPGTRKVEALFSGSVERILSIWTDRIICVSDFEHKRAIADKMPSGKLVTVEIGIVPEAGGNRDELRAQAGVQSPDEFVIGYIGRFNPQKDPMTLMKAVAAMKAKGAKNFRLIMIGFGPLEVECKAFAAANGLGDSVRFLGAQTGSYWIPAFDVLALSSASESWPRVMLEAAFAGVPVVATRVGTVPQFIEDGVQGFTVEIGDDNGIAEDLTKLYSSPELRAKMSEQIQLRSRLYTIERMVEETEQVYYDALGYVPLPCESGARVNAW